MREAWKTDGQEIKSSENDRRSPAKEAGGLEIKSSGNDRRSRAKETTSGYMPSCIDLKYTCRSRLYPLSTAVLQRFGSWVLEMMRQILAA